ncbi:MAG: GTP-binding protein [gamma proteobacterium symbiont of Lucinoma myriamae]|nr:GTP-binding protein [gamma proteobacterium symbiont of Lucinoma myriamae]MCU7817654.1 GTP-binding protein [gamma proteobacterium symbiont of Lucinoma myriamae]MCU7832680.1 GTP-binding protein [gamma proteobacterium symbiont of Lucinoma myriamae]
MMTTKIQAIPTNLITGFLGSGKTTAILKLLRSRPENSRWAVLVNEFGDVGIDGAMLETERLNDGVFIKEVPGGCLCCAAGLPLQIALNLLIKKAAPDRILIEPTGVGHPKKVLDVLTGEFYQSVLDLKATICLVEAHKLTESKYLDNETFIDQLNIADIVLASKSDQATEEELKYFYEFFQSYEIPKDHVNSIEFGQFSYELLNIERNIKRCVTFPDAHSHVNKRITETEQIEETQQEVSAEDNYSWQKFENNGQGYYGCGWIFSHSIVFDEDKLEKFFKNDTFSRVKGIFHTNNNWLLFNRSEQDFTKEKLQQSADSRIEIIEPDYHDWNLVEEQLLACIYSN